MKRMENSEYYNDTCASNERSTCVKMISVEQSSKNYKTLFNLDES